MFGHKSSNQTTVGTAVVQNPSMLDNVSTDDFSGSSSGSADVQQQVQDALNKKEMQTMLDSATSATPVVAGGTFMASPSATPTAVIAPAPDPDDPAVMPAPDPVADTVDDHTTTASEEPVVQSAPETTIPRPLTPEENKEIESHPIISSISSPTSVGAGGDESELSSPSAPIAPPPPLETVSTAAEPATVESTVEVSTSSSEEEVSASTDSVEEPTSEVVPVPEAPSDESTAEESTAEDSDDSTSQSDAAPEIDTDKLAGMKQQALEHLEPLVDHLDQTPEEEFRTTMMRIQANDNHTLLERAFNAAKKIPGDKERAQAMLDIVNEINYFSQSNNKN